MNQAVLSDNKTSKAIIYCRSACKNQVAQRGMLDEQEASCRDYAKRKGYKVEHVFIDNGFPGTTLENPSLKAMLSFLETNPGHTVIIDDIARLARNLEMHVRIREIVDRADCRLESPNMELGEDAESRFVEHMIASVAQHGRHNEASASTGRRKEPSHGN